MKIQTFLLNNGTGAITLGDVTFTPDSPTKATCLYDVTMGSSLCSVTESVEAAREVASGGNVRIMAKSTLRIPRPGTDYMGTFRLGAPDQIPVHAVINVPKAVAEYMAGSASGDLPIRQAYCFCLARALRNCAAMLEGGLAQMPLPSPADKSELTLKMLASTAPLKRAVSGVQPLDVYSGLLAGAV